MEPEQTEPQREELERLRTEVAELRASRLRLVLAGDADSRAIEGELHDSLQQHLVALGVKVQLAGPLVDSDPKSATALLEEIEHDVQEALDEAGRLAQRIYLQLLETSGLAAALRAAAANAGVRASVEVEAGSAHAPETLRTVYLCWLEALAHASGEAPTTARVKEEEDTLTFEFAPAGEGGPTLTSLRDRVEALGGGLTIEQDAGRGTRLSGWLPVSAEASRFPPDRGSQP